MITHCIYNTLRPHRRFSKTRISANFLKYFRENHIKSNPVQCYFMVISRNPVRINIEDPHMYNRTEEKLLGVKIDLQLLFESQGSTLCKKASQKLYAL